MSAGISDKSGAFQRASFWIAAWVMLALCPPALGAQTSGQAVSGTVKSQAGVALAGATVTLIKEGASSGQTAQTSQEGEFSFASVEPGHYTLQAILNGFEPSSPHPIEVSSDRPATADFLLKTLSAPSQAGEKSSGGSISTPPTYDDSTPLKPSTVKGAVDAGGYSSPGQARTSRQLIQGVAGMKNKTGASADSPAALRDSERAARMNPSENNLFNWGSELLLHGSLDAAIGVFSEGVARYPVSAALQIGYGVALYSRGRYEEAIKALCTAADVAPDDPRAYLFLGKMYAVAAPNAGEVSARLERFMKAQPQNAQAHFYYAMSLWKGQGSKGSRTKVEEIESHLKRAAQLDPKFPDAHFELGNLYAREKELSKAIGEYQQAIVLQPDFADAHYRLAQAYTRVGEKALAQREFARHDELRKQQLAEEKRQRGEIQELMDSMKETPRQEN